MAERNLNIMGVMKQNVFKAILSDEDVMKLVLNTDKVTLPEMSARYTKVYPWKKFVNAEENAETIIGFDIALGSAVNCAVKPYTLYIWIITHESLMKIDNTVGKALGIADRGTRIDILADKIDYLLNGSVDMGFGKLELQWSDTFEPANNFCGRALQYSIQGWNRYGEKL